jgi:hypothetical protein
MADNELANVDAEPESIDVENAEGAEVVPEQPAAEAAETEEEPAPETPTDEPPKVGENKELKEKIEKLERRQLYLQRQLEKQPAAPAPAAVAEPEPLPAEAPKEEDFDTYELYQDALVDFKVKRQVAQYTSEQEAKRAESNNERETKAFIQDIAQQGAAKYSDFEEVAFANNVPVTDQMIQILRTCENPAEVAYHLGQNIQTCVVISRMNRDAAVRELTKLDLEAGSSGTPAVPAAAKTITNAPPPIKPTKSENVITKDPDKMTQAEYEAWRLEGGGK